MRRWSLLLLLSLVACGDDAAPAEADPAGTVGTATDDVVVSVAYEGGFAPVEALFARTPVTLITGDGLALSTGPVPAIFPGPLLPNVLQRTITADATEDVLALADELGLLADITYAPNNLVADAPDAVVTITVDGTTYEHRAYALGIDDGDDPDRDRLLQFVTAMTDLPATVGADQLGADEPFVADGYLIRATPVDLDTMTLELAPTEWPADAPAGLADAADCAQLPRDVGDELFTDATTQTIFTDAGVSYQLSAVPRIPGRRC